MLKLLLPLYLFFFPNEINIANSVDWLCYEANTIATVKVSSFHSDHELDSSLPFVVVEITKVYKGNNPQVNKVYIYSSWDNIGRDKWVNMINKEVLVFVKDNGCDKYCSYEIFDYSSGMVNLESPQPKVLTGEFKSLGTKDEVLTYVSSTVQKLEGKTAKPYFMEVPFETEAYGVLWAGSSCYLIVPDILYPKSKSTMY